MANTEEQVTFKKYGGIYYTDQVTFADDEGTLEVGKLSFTSDTGLIGERIDEVTARHVRSDIVLVRGKA